MTVLAGRQHSNYSVVNVMAVKFNALRRMVMSRVHSVKIQGLFKEKTNSITMFFLAKPGNYYIISNLLQPSYSDSKHVQMVFINSI